MGASPIIPVPEKFKVFYDRDKLVIRRKWFGPHVFFLIPFTVFWDGFLVFWFYQAISNERWEMVAFGSLHAFVGLVLTYSVIANFTNATDVSVDPQNVEVKIHPFPWPGNKRIRTTDIVQLFCDEKVTHTKNGTSVSYAVRIIDQAGKSTKLVGGLNQSTDAKFIESKIESILGIENRRVAGEI